MTCSKQIAQWLYEALDDKKAVDLTLLGVSAVTTLADYFIVVTGTSTTHIQALANHAEKVLAEKAIFLKHKEGKQNGGWLLLDFKDVVVHIFSNEMRQYYSIERIWSDAENIQP